MLYSRDHKYEMRLELVLLARSTSIRAAMRQFGCARNTVRLWLGRFEEGGRDALRDRSRAPHHIPHKTPAYHERRVLEARRQVPCYGPARLKQHFHLHPSQGAIARILRQAGLTRKRRRRSQKKNDLRAVKARYRALERFQLDTKALFDIAAYWPQMKALGLPRYLYTHRDVKSGAVFTAYADDLSMTYAELAARAIAHHLLAHGVDLHGTVWQTDNGTEYGGTERHLRDRGFHARLNGLGGIRHRFNPPHCPNANADAESFHQLVEAEFFDLEPFRSLRDFLEKTATYQHYFNFARTLSTKNNQTPAQILRQDGLDPKLLLLPPLYLPSLLHQHLQSLSLHLPQGGQNLPVDTAFRLACPRVLPSRAIFFRLLARLLLTRRRNRLTGENRSRYSRPVYPLLSTRPCRRLTKGGQRHEMA
jgi:transposase InsO family protein